MYLEAAVVRHEQQCLTGLNRYETMPSQIYLRLHKFVRRLKFSLNPTRNYEIYLVRGVSIQNRVFATIRLAATDRKLFVQ